MQVSSEIVDYTRQAMAASLAPQTPSNLRHQYQTFLEQLVGSQECSAVLQMILSADFDDQIGLKILALSMLHDWIKKWWNKITPVDHLGIRSFCANILKQPAIHAQPSNFRSKLASILAEIGERQFPQDWRTMIQDLCEAWVAGPQSIQEIVLKTITYIYTDCTDTDFSSQLPTIRRQEILAGLKACDGQLLSLLYQFFATQVHLLMQPEHSQSAAHSTMLALQLVAAMAGLENHEKFIDPAHNFLPPLGACIKLGNTYHDVKLEATQAIQALLKRKIVAPETAATFLVNIVDCLVLEGTHLPTSLEDRIPLVRSLCTSFSAFLALNLGRLFENDAGSHQTCCHYMDGLFQSVLQMLHMDGRQCAGETIPDWSKFFKDDSVMKYTSASAVAQALLDVYVNKAMKPLFLAHPRQYPEEEWFDIEFESMEDWTDFYGLFLNHLPHFVQAISSHFPEVTGSVIQSSLQRVVSCTEKADYAYATPLMQVVTRLFMGLLDTEAAKSKANITGPLLALLMQFHPPSTQDILIEEKLKCLCLYVHVAASMPESSVIQILGHLFTYLHGSYGKDVQMEAGRCFSLFMSKAADIVAKSSEITQILQQTSQALPGMTNIDTQTSVQQSLVALYAHLPASMHQTLCDLTITPHFHNLQSVICALLGHLDGQNMENYLQVYHERNYLQASQLVISHFQAALSHAAEIMSQVRYTIRRISSIFAKVDVIAAGKSSSKLIYSIWQQFLDYCLFLLVVLQSKEVLAACPFLHGVDSSDIKRYAHTAIMPAHSALNFETKETIMHCYKALALACKHLFAYAHKPLQVFIYSHLPQGLIAMPNPFVILFCKHFLPFYCMHLPTESVHECVQFMRHVLHHMQGRLSVAWGLHSESDAIAAVYTMRAAAIESYGLNADQATLVREGFVFDLTKSFCEALCTIYGIQGPLVPIGGQDSTHGSTTEEQKAVRRGFLRDQVLHSTTNLDLVLAIVEFFFALPSSALTVYALQISFSWLDCLHSIPRISTFLAREVFRACIYTMLKQDKAVIEGQEWQYIDLILHIFATIKLGLHRETLTIDGKSVEASNERDSGKKGQDSKKSNMTAWNGPAAGGKKKDQKKSVLPKEVTELPLQVLLDTRLVTAAELETYSQQLLANQGKKKQQRALTKDVIAMMVQRLHGPDQLAQLGTILAPTQPKIQNLSQRLNPNKAEKERRVVKNDLSSVDIGGLFDDDPDL